MRIAVVSLSVLVSLLSACSSAATSEFDALEPRQPAFCSDECEEARSMPSCANWTAPELDTATIGACIEAMPCETDPALGCPGESSHRYDWDCYVGCVMMESQAVQDRVLANLRCDFPPSVCH